MNSKKTAYHEAGHALIGWSSGFYLDSVTINPMPGTVPQEVNGVCWSSSRGGHTALVCEPQSLNKEKVYFSMAGRVADEIFFPSEPSGSARDFENIMLMLPEDNTTLKMIEFSREGGNTVDDFYRRFKGPVKKIMTSRRGKKALRSLSQALLNAGTLSGSEAVSILEKAWGQPLPVKAKPAGDHLTIKTRGIKTYDGLLQSLTSYAQIILDDINDQLFDLQESENEHLGRIRHQALLLKMVLSK